MNRRAALLLGVVAALGIAAAIGWSSRASTVPALEVAPVPLVRTVQFSGRVASAQRVEVGATITGRAAEVSVDEGARVRRGDVLLRLETGELRAALDQAIASEKQAEARLSGLRGTGRAGAAAALAQAESVLVAARADLRRTEDLVATGFLSPARLDEARRAVAVAEAQVAGARAQTDAVADGGTDIAQARSQLALAQAARSSAQARLEQAVITAPADARVLSRSVEPGQIVQPGRALLTLALASPLQFVAPVDERYLEQLAAGQRAFVVADAFPQRRFEARIASIAPLVDAQRGSVEVKFSPEGEVPDTLREDMTLSIEVETARVERALVVPLAALRRQEASGDGVVHVIREGRLEARRVRLGVRTLDAVEVRSGLAAGDAVSVAPAGSEPAMGARVRALPLSLNDAIAAGHLNSSGESAGRALTRAVGR